MLLMEPQDIWLLLQALPMKPLCTLLTSEGFLAAAFGLDFCSDRGLSPVAIYHTGNTKAAIKRNSFFFF